MQNLSFILLLIPLFFVPFLCNAEVRFDFNENVEDLNIYIVKAGEELPPDPSLLVDNRPERYYGDYYAGNESLGFENLDAGRYTLLVGYLAASFSHEFIYYKSFKYDGEKYVDVVDLPAGRLNLKVTFEGIEMPYSYEGKAVVFAKLDRLDGDELDPIFKRWIIFNGAEKLLAEVPFMVEGRYRISFFFRVSKKDPEEDC